MVIRPQDFFSGRIQVTQQPTGHTKPMDTNRKQQSTTRIDKAGSTSSHYHMHTAINSTIPHTKETSTKAVKLYDCRTQVTQQPTNQTKLMEHHQKTTINHHNTQQSTNRIKKVGSKTAKVDIGIHPPQPSPHPHF